MDHAITDLRRSARPASRANEKLPVGRRDRGRDIVLGEEHVRDPDCPALHLLLPKPKKSENGDSAQGDGL